MGVISDLQIELQNACFEVLNEDRSGEEIVSYMVKSVQHNYPHLDEEYLTQFAASVYDDIISIYSESPM